ncbi:MAG: glycosyltransferase family 87 protein [Alphaproteobacteria bacterium]
MKWVLLVLGSGALAFHWAQIVVRGRGDFPNHWEFGRRILAGDWIYEGGLNFVYPPFWALAHAPLTVVGPHLAQVAGYPLAPLSIAVLLWVLHRLSLDHVPLDRARLFWATSLAVVLASPFLLRDLTEIGVNTMLVALSWLAILLWCQKRDVLAGVSLGLAAALKCTPVLFIAYFALKRQWRFVLASLASLAVFSVLPVFAQGPDQYVRTLAAWADAVVRGVTEPDPSRGVLGEDKVGNLSLRPAMARYLMRLPPRHRGRPETSDSAERPHGPPTPLYLHVGSLPPFWAGVVVKTTMGFLLLGVGWLFRAKVHERQEFSLLWECATVSLLILLFSPITWRQHAVGVLPALYLICRAGLSGWSRPVWVVSAVAVYTVSCVLLNRGFLGRDLILLLDSYHVKTVGICALTLATLGCRNILLTSHPSVSSGRWRVRGLFGGRG